MQYNRSYLASELNKRNKFSSEKHPLLCLIFNVYRKYHFLFIVQNLSPWSHYDLVHVVCVWERDRARKSERGKKECMCLCFAVFRCPVVPESKVINWFYSGNEETHLFNPLLSLFHSLSLSPTHTHTTLTRSYAFLFRERGRRWLVWDIDGSQTRELMI